MTQTATMNTDAHAVLSTTRSLPLLAVISFKFEALVTKWVARKRTRRALHTLEAWQLADVGLTSDVALIEARKVFWKA
ncbi:DUF1127 domain-containing protein [Sulfitobacter sp.]|uniref:DUF1127 domain-containing protein n=1 Tax=Sulfitobacter sp. TaxID=1903071 RepID=UPI003003890B